jgi:two-component system sensor histidine kinase NreB
MKYAKADLVTIDLHEKNGELELVIRDNGIGFNTATRTPGLGLTNMRSRATILGGSFLIESYPPKGTIVTVRIPVKIIEGKCIPSEQMGRSVENISTALSFKTEETQTNVR